MENLQDKTLNLDSSWSNVYWFARLLIASESGGFGKKQKLVENLTSKLKSLLNDTQIDQFDAEAEQGFLRQLRETLKTVLAKSSKGIKTIPKYEKLAEQINSRITSLNDVRVLIFTCEVIVTVTNEMLTKVPSDDRAFTSEIENHLKLYGEQALPTVINLWDDIGTSGSLSVERIHIVEAFSKLRQHLDTHSSIYTKEDSNNILTAFMQEVERRVSQKRKKRAGRSLEDVTGLILSHFNIPTTDKPEHFRKDLEVDKFIKTSNGWLIGISCKRTIRERWKQLSSGDKDVLSTHKIKEIWHVVTHFYDLSEDKLVTLGANRQVFYLPDGSPEFLAYSQHQGMSSYVRPMSQFISDLQREIGKK